MVGMIFGFAATAAATAAPVSTQARFDAANAAAAERRCPEAVTQYEALAQLPAIKRNALARGTIAVRKGICLARLGRVPEAEASIRAGLPTLEGAGAEFGTDVRDGRLALSAIAQGRFDYDAAIAEAEKALAAAPGFARVMPLLTLSSLTLFDGDGRALRYADEARTLTTAETTATKKDVAAVQTQYARALLNAGRTKEAYALLKDSLAKQGGLDTRINLAEVSTRSDLAIAALLTGDKDGARKYLAYTGAGRISEAPFTRAESMTPPACDPAIGLKPSDVAVIEFSLSETGQVTSAMPIYVTGNRAVATAFARAVSGWSWKADQAKAVPIFYRALTRVELRCSTAADVPNPVDALLEVARPWLYADATPAWDGMPDAAAAPLQQAALASAQPGSRAELAALVALTANVSEPDDTRRGYATRAAALAPALSASTALRAWLAIRTLPDDSKGDRTPGRLRAILSEPTIANDPLSSAVLRLQIASPFKKSDTPADAESLLEQVIATPGLPEHHPVKVNALLRRANLLAEAGDTAGAEAAFARTGLSAEQCAMLGVTPAMRSNGASANDFPREAQLWGFEGWVRTEFDIAADGRTAQQRALIAYPPFVFDDAATGIARESRWASSYRPGGAVACAASQLGVRFLLPNH